MITTFLRHICFVLLALVTFISKPASAAIPSPISSSKTSVYDTAAVATAASLLNSSPAWSSWICSELLKSDILPVVTKTTTSTQVKLTTVTNVVNTVVTKSATRTSTILVAKTITQTSSAIRTTTDSITRLGKDETKIVPITITVTRTETYTLDPTSVNLVTATTTSFVTKDQEVTLGPGTTITVTVETAAPIGDFIFKRAQSTTKLSLGAKFPTWQLPSKLATIDAGVASQACRNLRAKASPAATAKTTTVGRVITQTRTQIQTQTSTRTTTRTAVQTRTVTSTSTAKAYVTIVTHLTTFQTLPGKTTVISSSATNYRTVTSVATGTPTATSVVSNPLVVVQSTEVITITEFVTDGTITITPTPVPITTTTTIYAAVTFTPVSLPNQGQNYWCYPSDTSAYLSQTSDITANACQSKCLEDKECGWFVHQRGQSLTTGRITYTCSLVKGAFSNSALACSHYDFYQIAAWVWAK